MEVVWVHLKKAEAESLLNHVGDSMGKAFVDMIFGPFVGPEIKKVKK